VREKIIKGLTKNVVVYLREGNHFLKEPFGLDLRDSGTEDHSIVYTSYPLEYAVIHGGKVITGWKEQRDGTWITHIPEVEKGKWYFRQLFVNHERRHRAQIPNKDEAYYFLTGLVDTINRSARINRSAFRFKPGDIQSGWTNLQDVEILKFFGWDETRLTISRVDEKESIVYFSGLSSTKEGRPFTWWGNRYLIENVYEGLDAPGEWYLNRKTGVLHYMPLPGETIEETEFTAPVTDKLVHMQGKPEAGKYIKNIHFKNLSFMYSGAAFPENGYSEIQSDVFVPGAFYADGVKNLTIEGNHFAHIGTYTIKLGPGCKDNRIVGNRIHDIGSGGIMIGETDDPESQLTLTTRNTITDNYLYDMGHIYLAGAGIWIGRSSHNHVAHNEIYDILGNAISVGWKWAEELTDAHHNVIEYNHIHDIGNKKLGGGSGIYTLSRQPGTTIRYNLIHDLQRYHDKYWKPGHRTAHPCFGLQLDRGSSQMTFEYNIIYNVTDNAYKHMNTANVVRNNIFAFTGDYVAVKRGKERFKGTVLFHQNIVVSDNGKLMGDTWLKEDCEVDYNIYWDVSGETADFTGMDFNKWQQAGYDPHSLFTDPLFEDPLNGDFTLKQESPAFDIGFVPIDLSNVGPRK
jgi:hypothetical protein